MPRLTSSRSFWLTAIGVLWLLAVVGSWFGVPWLVSNAVEGESIEFLNRRIASHRAYGEALGLDRSPEWYAGWARGYAIKAAVLATAGAAAAVAFLLVPGIRRRLRKFFFAASSPLNLGVFRIAVFGMLLFLLMTEPILKYANWPHELFVWPAVGGQLLKHLPISPEIVQPLLILAMLTTGLTIIGLWTRANAWISVLLACYLIGIPQSSGKVDHIHHVLLLGALLACSRCGDALSVDGIRMAIRRADHGLVGAPRASLRYGLPLRISMLLIALLYFFPGFWKVATNGPEWIFSDNLENQMLQKWFELEYYTPPIAIHQLPYAGQMGALTAVVFELFFPIAILWRSSRIVWAGLGLFFHNMTRVLMNISFITLQSMYVVFVDWSRLGRWLGSKLFPHPLIILYDNHCKLCRRTISILAAFDWLGRLQPVSAFERERLANLGLEHLDDADLMTDMHSAVRQSDDAWNIAKGYAAYQHIAWRVPLLWPMAPLMLLPPVAAIGRSIYRRVADSRACQVVSTPVEAATRSVLSPRWSAKPLIALAVVILSLQALLGVGRIRAAWPVACYPLFDSLSESTVLWPEFELAKADGTSLVLDDDPLRDHLGKARYVVSLKRFLANDLAEADVQEMLAEFVPLWQQAGFAVEPGESLQIYSAFYQLTGTSRPAEPVERTLLLETTVPQASSAGTTEAAGH